MKRYQIPEIKELMTGLFKGTVFDSFLVTEGEVTTLITYTIQGTIHKEYLDTGSEDAEEDTAHASVSYIPWSDLKKVVFDLMRGSRPPLSLHLVLRLGQAQTEGFLKKSGLALAPHDIAGLFVNIRLESGAVSVTSGSSLRIFTLDKTLEHAWDDAVGQLLKAAHIAHET